MGNSLRATPTGAVAPLLNPAAMSLDRRFAVGANYQYRASDEGNLFYVSAVDAVTARLAAGIAYSFVENSPNRVLTLPSGPRDFEESFTTHEVAVSTGYPLGQSLAFGSTWKYVSSSSSIPQGFPDSIKPLSIKGFTMDAGVVIRPISAINIALIGYNILGLHDFYYPRSMGVGSSFALGQKLLVAFDAVLDFTSDPNSLSASYHGGLELQLEQSFALRAGGMHDDLFGTTFVSGGASLVSPRISLDLALRQMVDGGSETQFSVGIQVYVR